MALPIRRCDGITVRMARPLSQRRILAAHFISIRTRGRALGATRFQSGSFAEFSWTPRVPLTCGNGDLTQRFEGRGDPAKDKNACLQLPGMHQFHTEESNAVRNHGGGRMPDTIVTSNLFHFDPNASTASLKLQLTRLFEFDHLSAEAKSTIYAEIERRNQCDGAVQEAAQKSRRHHTYHRRPTVPLSPDRILDEIRFLRDPKSGIFIIQIPGKKPLRPTRLLGHFAFALSNDSLPTDDDLVAWKERKWICKALSQLENREVSINSLNQTVYRLRRFFDNGARVGGDLVQVAPDGRIRIAIRHHNN